MAAALVLGAVLLLAFANGANDNPKGVATLLGSGVLSERTAIGLATLATAIGALLSAVLAVGLVRAFTGHGLLPDAAITPWVLGAAALAAAATVLLATRLGLPVSTTHALVGGLVGAGLVASGGRIAWATLGSSFALPLLASPFLALAIAWPVSRGLPRRSGSPSDATCVCVGDPDPAPDGLGTVAFARATPALWTDRAAACEPPAAAPAFALTAASVETALHLVSATAVSFARGLNDTPKLLGILVGASVLAPETGAAAIALTMAVGGLVASRRVAVTLAHRIVPLNREAGLVGNLTTSLLVLGASRLGVPVSTTHVATGGILGAGARPGTVRWRAVGAIVLAWIVTLPLAAAIAGVLLGASR